MIMPALHTSDSELIRGCVTRMYAYITTDPIIKVFHAMHLQAFDVPDDEHRFEWTSLHSEYEDMCERKLTDLACEFAGYESVKDFLNELKKRADNSPKEQRLVDLLVAVFDYDKFVALMKAKCRSRREEMKAEDSEDEDGKVEEKDCSGGDSMWDGDD